MINIFEKDKIDIANYWTVNADINEAKMNTWKLEAEQVDLDRSISRLDCRMESKQMEILRRHHMSIIETAREKINTTLKNMISSCVFILVTVEGIVPEGTVRNVLKNIYRKVEVANKGSFIRKFMV